MINDDNPYDPIPFDEAKIKRRVYEILERDCKKHGKKHEQFGAYKFGLLDAICIAIEVVTGKKIEKNIDNIINLLESDKMLRNRIIEFFDKEEYRVNSLYPAILGDLKYIDEIIAKRKGENYE